MFNEVYERTTTVSTALNNILEWSMKQFTGKGLNKEIVNLQEIVQEQINLVLYNADKKEITITHETSNSSSIIIEPEHLRIIIRNLISNSVKFSEQGKNIVITYKDSPPFLSIEIKDEGRGMTKSQAESIFDAMGQSERGTLNEIGTGLGLSLCKEYMELNGGQIKITSEEGVGTTFTLLFKKI